MSQYGWPECPSAVRAQIERLLTACHARLAGNLIGVYLHGSLAMGCFNPARSDLDLLVVSRDSMEVETKHDLIEDLLRISGAPSPIEISFLRALDLVPWRHPAPFDLHYGESLRERYTHELADGRWRGWNETRRTDPDLAAHVTVLRRRGIALHGPPIADVFPDVPAADYVAAIWGDFLDARRTATRNPAYFILNACRIQAYLRDSRVMSKDEGGDWALRTLAEPWAATVARALAAYRGESGASGDSFDAGEVEEFAAYMDERLHQQLDERDEG
jgi:predicted nucleotidyltransferase